MAGYKIHYGNFTGYSYTTNTDVGNVTTYTLSGVNIDSSVAITAYDGNIDGTDDQVEGYQSWFATAIIPPYAGPVWYVSTSGSDANEGSEEEPFATISLGNVADVNSAVKAAKEAFSSWKKTSKEERISLIQKLLEIYKSKWNEMTEAISMEMGAPLDWASSAQTADRKSTRLNSSHALISYAVFCLKKKKKTTITPPPPPTTPPIS